MKEPATEKSVLFLAKRYGSTRKGYNVSLRSKCHFEGARDREIRSSYYDLELTESETAFAARMVKKRFESPVTHTPEEYDLETQSCNVRAIAFYRSQGFVLIGFDACCYANNDAARHEVRFNFGFYLNKDEAAPGSSDPTE